MIDVLSDIHFHADKFEELKELFSKSDSKYLILAGDIVTCELLYIDSKFGELMKEISKRYNKVFVVLGNHDYWYSTLEDAALEWEIFLKEFPNVYLLTEFSSIVETDDFVIAGGTLWTDFNKSSLHSLMSAANTMNDYRYIHESPDSYKRVSSYSIYEQHIYEKNNLEKFIEKEFSLPKIAVSHHAISKKSIPKVYEENEINHYYFSNLESFISESDICLYVHGHIHSKSDYFLRDTRVVCNPYGYNSEKEEISPELLTIKKIVN